MCYDVTALTFKSKKYANHLGLPTESIDEILKKTPPIYHSSGFSHPDLPVVTDKDPDVFQLFEWGLIPPWVKDAATSVKISNTTLNARGETIFDKPSFRNSAKSKRCLVIVDGFFEHHHYQENTYPFHIRMKNDEPIALAGLWENWNGKNTCSIITTEANPIMAKIHNNPKASETHRMPAIIPKEFHKEWLKPIEDDLDKKQLLELIMPFDQEQLTWYNVSKLRGKVYLGNKPEILEAKIYPELDFTS
ncbi:SOS response-associated peptidase [Fulvivirga ligni]|uniref:SOS response-associated peptidase n=1 Tax=Fulvivirga ligni TaxID=2904246 RepID=UPI001F1FB227|nr:SOS response-associated peptidase [Fulvivirga ligni]UII20825.1 SOS response-associated peptidase [Fulvivirga ligni]